MSKITGTKDGVTIRLSTEEATDLAAFIGQLPEGLGGIWYDQLADVLEAKTVETYVDADGETRETSKTAYQLTDGEPSDKARTIIHDITVRQLRLHPGHYTT